MKRTLSFMVVLFLLTATTFAQKRDATIIRTTAKLDTATLSVRKQLESNRGLPQDKQAIDQLIGELGKKSYAEYAGVHPPFLPTTEVDSVVDKNGFKTMHLFHKGEEAKYTLIYLHGGAFYFHLFPLTATYCSELVDELDCEVYVPLYPLVPRYHIESTFEMLFSLYRQLLRKGKPVLIMGDSAGGNLTLTFALYLKSLGIRMPEALFPISPIVDFRLDNPEIAEVAKIDPVLSLPLAQSVRYWMSDGMDLKDWRVSPLLGDLKGMPKTLYFIGSDDLMMPDVMLCHQKMREAGVVSRVLYGVKLWHVAVQFPIEVKRIYFEEARKILSE